MSYYKAFSLWESICDLEEMLHSGCVKGREEWTLALAIDHLLVAYFDGCPTPVRKSIQEARRRIWYS